LNYRAEIDGLRAIAVLPVILYHAGIEFFSGGFLGVDVFFVISGYLITSILYQQAIEKKYSILNFYDRRIRRIIPPLILTAIITIAIAATFTPSDIKNVGQSLVATFTFLSNYFFYLETDYFNPFNQATPMLHTWSLSVEEQYYIVAPLLIYFTTRFRYLKYLIVISLLFISFYSAVTSAESNPVLSFYSIHTRAWELLIGTLLAFIVCDFHNLKPNSKLSEIISITGLMMIILSFILIDQSFKHPSFVTLIPTLGTALVIFYSSQSRFSKYFLSNQVFVFIGLISYSLYLIHNPIFSGIKYHFDNEAFALKLLSLPIVFALAFLSFKFIEKPSRNSSMAKAKVFYPIICGLVLMILFVGFLAHSKHGFLEYFRSQFSSSATILVDVDAEKDLIEELRQNAHPSDKDFSCKNDSCKNLLIIGDSFSEDAYLSMISVAPSEYSIRRVWYHDECLSGFKESNLEQACKGKVVDLSLLHDADIVLIVEKWQESSYKPGLNFSQYIKDNFDVDVILVGSVMFEDLNSFAFKLKKISHDLEAIARLAYKSQRFDRQRSSEKLKQLVSSDARLHWIEKFDLFCDKNDQKCYLYDDDFNPLILDNAHLTSRTYPIYGEFLVKKIASTLNTVND